MKDARKEKIVDTVFMLGYVYTFPIASGCIALIPNGQNRLKDDKGSSSE